MAAGRELLPSPTVVPNSIARARLGELISDLAVAPSKLERPRAAIELLERPRLDALLAGIENHVLSVVVAPAGFGKSSSVAAWAGQARAPVAWLRLDAQDNQPARFVAAVLAAVASAQPELTPPSWPGGGRVEIQTWLARRLLIPLAQVQGSLTLVLDEIEAITAPEIWDALAWLLDNHCSRLRLCVLGREQPSLASARLEAAGSLLRIGPTELRFDADELRAAAASVLGREPTPSELAWLTARSEGWPVALRLLCMGLRSGAAPSQAHDARTAEPIDRRALGYVIEEVVDRLPTVQRRRLLATSILDELEPDACAAVSGEPSDEPLWTLFDAGLCVREGETLRHHALLREALRMRLPGEPGLDPAQLHARAARWYLEQGREPLGLHHAVAAGELGLVAERVVARVWPTLRAGEFGRLADLLKLVEAAGDPASLELELRAPLALALAWSTLARNPGSTAAAIVEATELVDRLEREGRPQPSLRGSLAALRGLIELRMGEPARGREIVEAAIAKLDNHERGLAVVLRLTAGLAAELATDWEPALEQLAMANRDAGADPPLASLPTIVGHRIRVLRRRARVSEARELAQSTRDTIEACGWTETPAAGQLDLEWAMLELARGEIERARGLAERGLRVVELGGDPSLRVRGFIALARIRRAAGDHDEAKGALDLAREVAATTGQVWLQLLVDIDQDPFASGPERLARLAPQLGPLGGLLRNELYLRQAQRWLEGAREQHERAQILAQLETELKRADAGGRRLEGLEHRALLAAFLAERDPLRARSLLDEALDLAEPEQLRQPFAGLEPRLRGLGRASVLLEAPSREAAAEDTAPLLSERELEVLAELARGLSNRLIASALHVSLATVKTHVHHILTKLEVTNRTGAVHRARELALLPR